MTRTLDGVSDTRCGALCRQVTDAQDPILHLPWGGSHSVSYGTLECQSTPLRTAPEMEAGEADLIKSPPHQRDFSVEEFWTKAKNTPFLLIKTLCTTLRKKIQTPYCNLAPLHLSQVTLNRQAPFCLGAPGILLVFLKTCCPGFPWLCETSFLFLPLATLISSLKSSGMPSASPKRVQSPERQSHVGFAQRCFPSTWRKTCPN